MQFDNWSGVLGHRSFKPIYFTFLLLMLFCIDIFVRCQYNAGDDIFFEILSPDSLKYTYKARLAQNFGVPFNDSMHNVALVVVEPVDACSTIANKFEVRNNIGLVERGGCSFLSKCKLCENFGLKGILVYDNVGTNDEQFIDMVTDTTPRNCGIPAAFILGRDGYMIRQQMMYLGLEQVTINIPVNISTIPIELQRNPPWVLY